MVNVPIFLGFPWKIVIWNTIPYEWLKFSVCWRETRETKSLNWVVVSNIFNVHPYLRKIPILTNIFQRGWNHQLVKTIKNIHQL